MYPTPVRYDLKREMWAVPLLASICLAAASIGITVRPGLFSFAGFTDIDIDLYYATLSLVIASLLVLSLILRYEGRPSGTREIAVIGALSALSAASRIAIPIPNFKPCTFLIIATGYVFGPEAGIMVGILTPAVSNMFLGQGYWTAWQMLMWAAAGWSGSILRRHFPKLSVEGLAAYAFSWGFIFGEPLDFATWLNLNANLSLLSPIMLSGIPWNLVDALGNLFFALVAGRYTITILERYRRRFDIRYLD